MAYTYCAEFQWDPAKAESNERKHGVAFEEAEALLRSELGMVIFDVAHSTGAEDRFLTIGPATRGVLTVVTAERMDSDTVRIVSARTATRRERALFLNHQKGEQHE